ncbi:MAG: hemerythrin domain-containing protein [Rhodospirillaceae bacterium]
MTALEDSKIREQHAQIEGMIKDLDAHASKGGDRDKTTRMISILSRLLRAHCDNEEKVMMMKGYKYLPSHRDDHNRIFDTLGFIVQVCNDKNLDIDSKIGKNIEHLVSEHVEKYDNQMITFLEKVG